MSFLWNNMLNNVQGFRNRFHQITNFRFAENTRRGGRRLGRARTYGRVNIPIRSPPRPISTPPPTNLESRQFVQPSGAVKRRRDPGDDISAESEPVRKKQNTGKVTLPNRVLNWFWQQKPKEEFYLELIADAMDLPPDDRVRLSNVIIDLIGRNMIKTKQSLMKIGLSGPPVEIDVFWHENPNFHSMHQEPTSIFSNPTLKCFSCGADGMETMYRNKNNQKQVLCGDCYQKKKTGGEIPASASYGCFVNGKEHVVVDDEEEGESEDEDDDDDDEEEEGDKKQRKKRRRKKRGRKRKKKKIKKGTSIVFRIDGNTSDFDSVTIQRNNRNNNSNVSIPSSSSQVKEEVVVEEEQQDEEMLIRRIRRLEQEQQQKKQNGEEGEEKRRKNIMEAQRQADKEEEKKRRQWWKDQNKKKDQKLRLYHFLFVVIVVVLIIVFLFYVVIPKLQILRRWRAIGNGDDRPRQLSDRAHMFIKEVNARALSSSEVPQLTKIYEDVNREFGPYKDVLTKVQQNSVLYQAFEWVNSGKSTHEEVMDHVRETIDSFIAHDTDSESL